MVTVQYLGVKKDLVLSLPYMKTKRKFNADKGNTAQMPKNEAEKLIFENPKAFKLLEAESDKESEGFGEDFGAE